MAKFIQSINLQIQNLRVVTAANFRTHIVSEVCNIKIYQSKVTPNSKLCAKIF